MDQWLIDSWYGCRICRNVESGKEIQESWWSLAFIHKHSILFVWQPHRSGHVSICHWKRLLLVKNISKGFDLYDLPWSSPSYAFPVLTKKRCIKAGVFAEDFSLVACRGDHSKIYMFLTRSPVPLQIMRQASHWTAIWALDVSSTPIKLSKNLPSP